MKRTVIFDIATGPGIPMTGSLYLRPTNRMVADQVVNLPHPEAVIINRGVGTAELEVTPADEAWVWEAFESAGRTGVPNRRFLVTEGDGVLSYSETPYADPPPASPEWGPTAERARAFAEQAAGSASAAASAADAVAESIDDAQELVDSIGGLVGIEEQVGRAEAAASNADSQADRASTEADRAVAAADSIDTTALEEQIGAKIGRTDVADGTLFQRSGTNTVGAIVSATTEAASIARRTASGALAVGNPSAASHAVPKGFLDNFLGFYDVTWFGAIGDGVTDDTSALQAAINSEKPLYWGRRTYRITSALTRVLTGDINWRSDGSKIVLDRPAFIARAVDIDAAGRNVYIDGPLTLDCARKAEAGWYFSSSSGDYGTFSATGLGVANVHLQTNTSNAGAGVTVRGGFASIIFNRPDVRNITMANGIGIAGSVSVAGIFIASSTSARPPGAISIYSPYIDSVYSENLLYDLDQDGIKIFAVRDESSLALSNTSFLITGGVIKNCGGRGIKAQTEFGVVQGVKFERTAAVLGNLNRTMPEVDFQVGGGTVRDIECNYSSSVPNRVVHWSGTRQVGGANALGIVVDNVRISVPNGSAANQMFNIVSLNMQEQLFASCRITNVEHALGSNALSGDFCTISGLASAQAIVNIDRVTVPLAQDARILYRRLSTQLPVSASISNVVNRRAQTARFSGVESGAALSVVTYGQNIRVVA